jgi:NAD(P)-dependent dehydrogenase (short-subunit alcohol dehydrogenase family)
MGQLQGKVALITGSGRGQGIAAASGAADAHAYTATKGAIVALK